LVGLVIYNRGHACLRERTVDLPLGLDPAFDRCLACLKELPLGTPFLVNTVFVGEESGKVGEALTEVAAYYEREAQRLLQMLAALLEPAFVVIVGLVVGFIVMSVLLPIFEMSSIPR
jgi:type II secretory pathway component PulF